MECEQERIQEGGAMVDVRRSFNAQSLEIKIASFFWRPGSRDGIVWRPATSDSKPTSHFLRHSSLIHS
jgi:hypothetical protein